MALKMLDKHHGVDRILKLKIFTCGIKKHAYHCEQPFNFCPSCGMCLTTLRGENNG